MRIFTPILLSIFMIGCSTTEPITLEPIQIDQFKFIKNKYNDPIYSNIEKQHLFFQFCIKSEEHCVFLIEEINFPLNGYEESEECYVIGECNDRKQDLFQVYDGSMNSKKIQYSMHLTNSIDISYLYNAQFNFSTYNYGEFVQDYFLNIPFSKEPYTYDDSVYSYFIAIK